MHSDYIVFVDESGDHSLTSIDPAYPVFVLSFCIFERSCYIDNLTPAVRRLKFETFGHDMVVLHEADIVRNKGAFAPFGPAERTAFMTKLGALIEACDFTLIAVVIDKAKHKAKYSQPTHPYHLSLQFGLERLHSFLKSKNVPNDAVTHIVCEARGKKEDDDLELAFRRVCDGDNRAGKNFPFNIVIADKKTNSEGLQLADLTARPIGLSVVRPGQQNQAFDVLKTKLFTGRGGFTIHGNGLKIFP
ncbi:hypothetical protein VAPA_1c13670 [Variovorax paradoxus B4]|uniref:3-deoxy-D-manno-octulosonic acid transferase n=1 Tax=Variovorax paradoxus B4 TaxID=1246301 RepID=T1X7M6_VARPD|nr:DUF3800 domain-containing protein [Variovorax paradoxus]AGU48481.1 hypothetical protein VAPA_1c13670 [Variovorax paradoxus B4]